jgi:kynureninase
MAEGLTTLMQGRRLEVVAPEDVESRLGEDVAVMMLTEVDYRTGRRHDMARLTAAAHKAGAVALWDLAHSPGALPVDLTGAGAEFACGCTYKYLNGGPGAPAFVYVRPDLADRVQPALAGWLGHAAPFDFDLAYRPGAGVARMRVGTPSVLQMAALDAALDIWDGVDMAAVRARSIQLSERFIAEALIARGVIGDFRAPDRIRFGFAPLYNTDAEVTEAAKILAEILSTTAWDKPEHHARSAVT